MRKKSALEERKQTARELIRWLDENGFFEPGFTVEEAIKILEL